VNDKGETVSSDPVKEEKEKAIQAIQKNQEMLQVWYSLIASIFCRYLQ
jgi:hypothetical protein